MELPVPLPKGRPCARLERKKMKFAKILARTAVAAAVAAVAGVSGAAETQLTTDIVVVGGGAAGMAALTQAVDSGKKAILLEKNAFVGGTTAMAEGLGDVQSKWQKNAAYSLSIEDAYNRLMNFSHYKANGALVRRFVEGSGENIDWLSKHNLKFKLTQMSPTECITWHVVDKYKGVEHGSAYIQALSDWATAKGGKIMLSTPAKSLIKEGGKVVGVKAADNKGNTYTIRAKAVIIASGGFNNSPERVRDWGHYNPEYYPGLAPINKTGDGIAMSMEAGAVTGEMALMVHPGIKASKVKMLGNIWPISWAPRPVWVNDAGRRFIRETVVHEFSDAGNVLGHQHNGYAWAIFDKKMVDYFANEGIDLGIGVLIPVGAKMTELQKELNDAIAQGSDGVKTGATFADLAKQIGVPADTFVQTMKRYNENAHFGYDRDFYKEREWLTPVETGPFYAVKIGAFSFTSIGGIKVDPYLRALDKNDKPVKGLYCTGMDAAGMYGDTYPVWFSGNGFGFSSWSGRHAALQAIEDEKI